MKDTNVQHSLAAKNQHSPNLSGMRVNYCLRGIERAKLAILTRGMRDGVSSTHSQTVCGESRERKLIRFDPRNEGRRVQHSLADREPALDR